MIPQTVHLEKYYISISLPKIQPVSDTLWRKKAGFDQIALTIYILPKSQYVDDLIPLIAREVPIQTFTAQNEADKVMHKVWGCLFDVNHLQASQCVWQDC